jgi:hypothetical protein
VLSRRARSFVDQRSQAAGVAAGNAHSRCPGVHRLAGEELQVTSPGAEGNHLEKVRGAVDDVNRLGADGAGGSEEGDLAWLHCLSIAHHP